jgi:hypothetical protein
MIEFFCSRWHISPDEIFERWTEERFFLLYDRMMERLEEEQRVREQELQ